jgi:hypothetical protein
VVEQAASGCTPTISSIAVDGQQTNTIVAGTAGSIAIVGKCLGGTQMVQIGGSGVSITSINVHSLDSSNDYQVNAYFQSASSSSTGSQTLTLTSNQGNASAQVFVTKATLQSVSFTGTVPYYRDCAVTDVGLLPPIAQPAWPAPATTVCPQDTAKYPGDHVVYVAGSTMTVNVTVGLSPAPPQPVSGIQINGTTSSYGTFSGTGTISGSTLSFSGVTDGTALTASLTQLINPLQINWSIAEAATTACNNCTFVGLGASSNPVLVTLAPSALSGPILLTYITLAVANGGARTPSAALENTWAQFSTGTAPANVTNWDNKPLYYYQYQVGFTYCATSAASLLTTKFPSGQCGSFALLLEAALGVNGIPNENSPAGLTPLATFTNVCPADGSLMLVNNWSLDQVPSYSSGSPLYPNGALYQYALITGSADYMVQSPFFGYGNSFYGDLTNDQGVSGQGLQSAADPQNTPSEKIFSGHFIVRMDDSIRNGMGPLFDPSYGVTYAGAADFETHLAGYALPDLNLPLAYPTYPNNQFGRYVVRNRYQPELPTNIIFPTAAPGAPGQTSPSNGSTQSSGVTLAWTGSGANATSYSVTLSLAGSPTPTVYYLPSTMTALPLLLQAGTYKWYVSAANCAYQTPINSPVWSFTVSP